MAMNCLAKTCANIVMWEHKQHLVLNVKSYTIIEVIV